MENVKIDSYTAALKLIEILFKKGMINQATYVNIRKHASRNVSKTAS